MEETGVPGENHCLTQSYWQLSHMRHYAPNKIQTRAVLRQLAVNGNAKDHLAIKTGLCQSDKEILVGVDDIGQLALLLQIGTI